MTIANVALRPAQCVTIDTSLREVAQLMLDRDINHVPVCEGGCYVGIVDVGDILGAITPVASRGRYGLPDLQFAGDLMGVVQSHVRDLGQKKVGEIVNREIPAVEESCPFAEALLLLSKHDMPLAVVDSQRQVLGMLSSRAVLRHLLNHARL
jgi:CBS domain-containing protein